MRVLVSTKETQGNRKNDFNFVDEGEILTFGSECDGESVDGRCGCKRALTGLLHGKATTTFKVVDLPITVEGHNEMVRAALDRGGWFKLADSKTEQDKWVKEDAEGMREVAAFFKVGDILEKRGKSYRVRRRIGDDLKQAVPS